MVFFLFSFSFFCSYSPSPDAVWMSMAEMSTEVMEEVLDVALCAPPGEKTKQKTFAA